MAKLRLITLLSMAVTCLPAVGVAALEGEVLVGYTLGYDDNITGGVEGANEENISNELYVNVDLAKTTGYFRYDVFGQAGFLAQSSETLDDDLRFSGGVNGLWIIKPNRLTWDFSDVATIRRRDSQGLTNTGNTEQANFFRTGPSLTFRPTGRTSLGLNAFYEQSWFEFSDSNEYVGFNASASYQATQLARWSTNYSEVYFLPDTNLSSDSVSRSASARFDRRIQRGSWFVGTGVSQVTLDEQIRGDNDDVIPTYSAGFNYQLARRLSFDISGARQVVTIGENTLDRGDRRSLSDSVDRTDSETGSQSGSSLTPFELSRLRDEVDQFQFGAGFNVSESVQTALIWQDGRWSISTQLYANSLELPDFQTGLSQEARQLLFSEGTLDEDQTSTGVRIQLGMEPRIRWFLEMSLQIENREIDTIDATAANPSQTRSTSELRETIFTTSATFAATRYLSFGASVQTAKLEDLSDGGGDIDNLGILFSAEYAL